jgi:hypothetical protein
MVPNCMFEPKFLLNLQIHLVQNFLKYSKNILRKNNQVDGYEIVVLLLWMHPYT